MNNYFLLMMVAATVSNAAIVDTVTETAKLHPKKTGALVGSLLIGTPTFIAWRRAERALEKHKQYLKHLVTAPTNEDIERRDALRRAARYARNRCIVLTIIGGGLGAGAGKWYEGRQVPSRSGSPVNDEDPRRIAIQAFISALAPYASSEEEKQRFESTLSFIPDGELDTAVERYSELHDYLIDNPPEDIQKGYKEVINKVIADPLMQDYTSRSQEMDYLKTLVDYEKEDRKKKERERLLALTAELADKGFYETARIAIVKDVPDVQREGKIALCALAVDRLTQVTQGLPVTASEARARLGDVRDRLLKEGTAEALDNALDEGLKIATPSDELNERARALNSLDTRHRSALTGHINSLRRIELEEKAAREKGEEYDGSTHIKESCFSLADKIITLEGDLDIWNQKKVFGNKQEKVNEYREKYKNLRVTEGKDLARRMLYAVVGAHWPDE
jgi:hypothetical protein